MSPNPSVIVSLPLTRIWRFLPPSVRCPVNDEENQPEPYVPQFKETSQNCTVPTYTPTPFRRTNHASNTPCRQGESFSAESETLSAIEEFLYSYESTTPVIPDLAETDLLTIDDEDLEIGVETVIPEETEEPAAGTHRSLSRSSTRSSNSDRSSSSSSTTSSSSSGGSTSTTSSSSSGGSSSTSTSSSSGSTSTTTSSSTGTAADPPSSTATTSKSTGTVTPCFTKKRCLSPTSQRPTTSKRRNVLQERHSLDIRPKSRPDTPLPVNNPRLRTQEILRVSLHDTSNTYIRPFEATGVVGAGLIKASQNQRVIRLLSPQRREPYRRRRIHNYSSAAASYPPTVNLYGRPRNTRGRVQSQCPRRNGNVSLSLISPPQPPQPTPPPPPPRTSPSSVNARILRRLGNPLSNELLFVNAVVEGGACYALSAATSNVFYESYGFPYNLTSNTSMTDTDRHTSPLADKLFHRQNLLRSFVNPQEIVRFALLNTTRLPLIVGCDLAKQLSLLNTCCQMEPLCGAHISRTEDRHFCLSCFRDGIRTVAAYASATSHRLYCEHHGRGMIHKKDIRMYLPQLISMDSSEDGRIWLSMFNQPDIVSNKMSPEYGKLTWSQQRGRWSRLVEKTCNGYKVQQKTSKALHRLSRFACNNNIDTKAADETDPVAAVKLLQRLCIVFKNI